MSIQAPDANEPITTPPIAIIGMACRYPGGANNLETFWKLLEEGVDAISEVPADRFDVDYYYEPGGRPGKVITRYGGFLPDIDMFDPSFFGILPREAMYIDPQHRLLLEVAWETIENGGQTLDKLKGSQTGVFIGIWTSNYNDRYLAFSEDVHFHILLGSPRYPAAGRISYAFDLRGPSFVVDTACSSSLVAVHLACQSIWSGESEMALAGGVNLILDPMSTVGGSQSDILSPNGRCKFGDVTADGYVRSEGVGMVMLKPLAEALADNDPIYAVVRGSAVNNDGRSGGRLSAPGLDAQIDVLRAAYHHAGVRPADISYMEAHGTGTAVGDPIEVKALATVLGENRAPDQPCILGSGKTNIGHTEAAAGVAGLIKAVLSLNHHATPANIHFNDPTPSIPWSELPFTMPTTLQHWPQTNAPAYAGVNSFGITGTNAHVVLQEPIVNNILNGTPTMPTVNRPALVPLSAHTPEALTALAQTYLDFVKAQADDIFSLTDFAYTLSRRRTHHAYRLTLVANNRADVCDQLQAFIDGETRPGMASGSYTASGNQTNEPIAFVCSGMGPQWWAMGRQLLQDEPVFRQAVVACDEHFKLLAGWSLIDELTATEEQSRIQRVDVSQPTNFALQVGLAALWQSWGIQPDAIVGHSTGEVATAYLSGILSLADAVKVTYHRSRLQQLAAGDGLMAAVGLPLSDIQEYLFGYEKDVSVAAINSPDAVTISGDWDTVTLITSQLEADGVFVRPLQTDVAYHSPHMDKLRAELLEVLQGINIQPSTIKAYSTVSGQLAEENTFDVNYWWANVREPVFFAQAISQMIADGYHTFVELSPHPVLTRNIGESLNGNGQSGVMVYSLRRQEPEQRQMLESLGALHTLGHAIDWTALYPQGQFVPVPTYPWQKESLWFEEERVQKGPARLKGAVRTAYKHPFLDQHIQTAVQPGAHLWEMKLDAKQFAYLLDHRIGDMAVVPGATWLEMVVAAAKETYGGDSCILEDVTFAEGYILSQDSTRMVQLVLKSASAAEATFQLFSRSQAEAGQTEEWNLHASGKIRMPTAVSTPPAHELPATIQAGCPVDMTGADLYQALDHLALSYGPGFRGIDHIWHQSEGTLGRLVLHESLQNDSGYHIHPALLDAAFQVLHGPVANLSQHDVTAAPKDAYIPVGVDSFHFYRPPSARETWCYTSLQPLADDNSDRLKGDVALFDESGQLYLELKGLRLQKLERNKTEQINEWLYDISWQQKALNPDAAHTTAGSGTWLILADNQGLGDYIHSVLTATGEPCLLIPAETQYTGDIATWKNLLQETAQADSNGIRAVLHLWSLESETAVSPTIASLEAAQEQSCISLLHLTQAMAEIEWLATTPQPTPPPLWVITRGAQTTAVADTPPALAQAPVWGLGKVIMQEHPEFNCHLLDLSPQTTAGELDALFQELYANDGEDHIALRPNGRYVARLVHTTVETAVAAPAATPMRTPAASRAYRLEGTPGVLDSLTLRTSERPQPEASEVCIEVRAAGLNFMDVLSALGALPSHPNGIGPLGTECAGVIVAVGEDITDYAVGDEVLALVYGSFVRYICTDARNITFKPPKMSFEEAATIPLAFLTAYYSLCHIGRLRPGERILIHTASGGVGLAAVQIAQSIGAEIYATAGSPQKRQFLHDLGIEHVYDSRTLDFAAEIMAQTENAGVDLVLNSLAGEFLLKSIELLGKHGRFVEIGKRDIYQDSQIGLFPFRRNLAFYAVDMDPIFSERRDFTRELLREIMAYVNSDAYKPLPRTLFAPEQIADAFQHMARAKHIGKIVVPFDTPADVSIAPARTGAHVVKGNATYLLTGGMGGLGLQVARWLVQQGARHLVLMGRSGAAAKDALFLDELAAAGATVVVAQADVTCPADVQRVIADINDTMPPLRGIVHAAGVLDDATVVNLNRERFAKVMAPKIKGAWNLHTQSLDQPLDFFLLFSSAASLFGTPGQGNYVAANSFMDALAHYRDAQKLPALSINWGAWAEVGMAAEQSNRGQRLAEQGIGSLSPADGIAALAHVFNHQKPQIGVMEFDFQKWSKVHARAVEQPLLAQLATQLVEEAADEAGTQGAKEIRDQIAAAPVKERHGLLMTHLREQIAKVLRVTLARIEPNISMQSLGVDSLMALEIRGRLEATFGVGLSGTMVWNYPTPAAMATHIAGKLGIPLENGVAPVEAPQVVMTADVEAEMLHLLETAVLAEEPS